MTQARAVAAEIENVVIRAGECSLTVLPQLGAKIASLKIRGLELLQAPLAPLAPRTPSTLFDLSDASGWDECIPSVAACVVQTPEGTASIPDHGDLWRVVWQEVAATAGSVTLRGEAFSLPLALERSIALAETGTGWTVSLDYELTNTGSFPVPWSWAAHPLFAAEPGDQILLPASVTALRVEGSGGNRLGPRNSTVQWPIAMLANGTHSDLSIALGPDSAVGDKLFTGPLPASDGWCTLLRPSAGIRLHIRFDPEATPYLGLWICHGGWPDRPGPKQTCIALEPSTAPNDSLAVTGPWSKTLAPGDSFNWTMQVELETL